MQPLLSILVCGLYERMGQGGLLWQLDRQAMGESVELLSLYDNRQMTVGRKRNILMSIARGEYSAFVDDDDAVADEYVETLLRAIQGPEKPDVITFTQICTHADNGLVETCRYSLHYDYHVENSVQIGKAEHGANWRKVEHVTQRSCDWYGKPAHTMCWRTDLVQPLRFPDGNFGEDMSWVQQACLVARTELQLPDTLYYYNYDPERSRTRGR